MYTTILHSAPLSYNSLVLETTSQCTSKCKICYQSSGPKGSDRFGKVALSENTLRALLCDALSIPTLERSLHIAGGEAFIHFERCIALFSHARRLGYTAISATTNAFWARKRSEAYRRCEILRRSGLLAMEISWDAWHAEFVSPQTIANCIDACADMGISTFLRVLTTKTRSSADALRMIKSDSLEKVDSISSTPVLPVGRAQECIDMSDIFFCDSLDDRCYGVLNLTVNAVGNVFPCCAGLDQTNSLVFGNVTTHSITEIEQRMQQSTLLRILAFGGAKALVRILRREGIKIDIDGFSSICHLCSTIFAHQAFVDVLCRHVDSIETRSIEVAIKRLKSLHFRARDALEDNSVRDRCSLTSELSPQ